MRLKSGAALLFAFLFSLAGSLICDNKGETLKDIFARKLAYTKASPFYRELHTPHLRRFLPKPWKPERGEILIDDSWRVVPEGVMGEPGTFATDELATFFADTAGILLKGEKGKDAGSDSSRKIILRVRGEAKNRVGADSYTLDVTEHAITITSPSWRGVLYGVYYLEQVLLERGIPAARPLSVSRRPSFDVRMFGDVYGTFTVSGLRIERPVDRNTFSALSRFGANATFSFVQLGDYLGGETFPELRNPDREKNLADLAKLAELSRSAGVDLYLDAYNPKLPDDHPVFAAHPNAKGATQHGGKIRCLCPSDPETLKFIAESWADVFRRVPALGGMVAIIGGEGFYHCYMRSEKEGPDCPRCSKRPAEDVVADLTNAVFRAIRRVKPDAELFAWPYSAFLWSKDPFQLGLISKLDPGIHIVPEIDKDHLYPKSGYVKNIWDYSIDFLGPSDRYKAMTIEARKRGLNVACKTETAVSLEMHSVPYIPCLQRWGSRMEIIKAQRPDSIYYAYDITGFSRSRPEELAGRLSWEPVESADGELRKIARRDFGPAAADKVIESWKVFSDAIGHTSYLTHGYYRGPSFIGSAQPLMLTEDNMPKELFGRFFYLAEGDLSEGTSEASLLRPIYAEEIKVSEPEAADMDKAAGLWDKGVEALEAARPLVQDHYRSEFERELSLAAYLQTAFRAVSQGNHFFTLRAKLRELIEKREISDRDREQALRLVSRMEEIVKTDLANARRGLELARRDPRLDLAVRLDLDYAPLTAIIEAKIKYAETEVMRQLADARRRIGQGE